MIGQEEQNYERKLFHQKEEVHRHEIKALKKEIFVSNLKSCMIGILLIAEIFFIVTLFQKFGIFSQEEGDSKSVAVIHYDKPVTEEFTSAIMKRMDAIKDDDSYESVLFIMSSPGGSPTASEELSEYLKAYQKDKNITMYVESIAASGGYYIASAVKPLIANKNAIVGSIGVIMPHYNLGELAKKIGVEEDFMAAGKFKKPISYFAKIDKENKSYMTEHLLKPTYENFIQSVANNRGLKKEDILPFADGKIYIANVPEIQGILVDKISSLYQVKEDIRKKLKNKDVKFEDISLKEKRSLASIFKVKVDIGLKELFKDIQMR